MRSKPVAVLVEVLALNLVVVKGQNDYDQPHSHVDNESAEATNTVNWSSRRIRVDSGAPATNVDTGTTSLLKSRGNRSYVVTG